MGRRGFLWWRGLLRARSKGEVLLGDVVLGKHSEFYTVHINCDSPILSNNVKSSLC